MRFGYSWPLAHGRRMWVSGPWWFMLIWAYIWLLIMAVVVAVWLIAVVVEACWRGWQHHQARKAMAARSSA